MDSANLTQQIQLIQSYKSQTMLHSRIHRSYIPRKSEQPYDTNKRFTNFWLAHWDTIMKAKETPSLRLRLSKLIHTLEYPHFENKCLNAYREVKKTSSFKMKDMMCSRSRQPQSPCCQNIKKRLHHTWIGKSISTCTLKIKRSPMI